MSDPSYSAPGGAAGVASFNTRQGAVVLTKADVTATGLAAGDVGAVAAPLALTFDQGVLAADVVLVNGGMTDVLVTNNLAIGTWLITFTGNVQSTNANQADAVLRVVAGTATLTVDGPDGVETTLSAAGASNYRQCPSFTIIAVITVAGTVKMQGQNFGTGATTVRAADSPVVHATGYTAVRIA